MEDLAGQGAEETMRLGAARGLDMTALARARDQAAAVDDDAAEDALEAAFAEATTAKGGAAPDPPAPAEVATSKKTRADLLAGLKASRVTGAASTEAANTKFKPIGFAPIGGPAKKKKKKAEDGAEGAPKKKRKVAEGAAETTPAPAPVEASSTAILDANAPSISGPVLVSDPPEDDFDIFAGAGEFEGVDLGDSDDDAPTASSSKGKAPDKAIVPPAGRKGWFDDPDAELVDTSAEVAASMPPNTEEAPATQAAEELESDAQAPARLAPLASSAIPSVRDILDADDAIGKEEKRRARKDKKKGKSGG
jgi:IK cytokine